MTENLLDVARSYRNAGLDVIPDHPIKKYPYGFDAWQTHDFTEEELSDAFSRGYGVGLRNQEGLDFDNHGNPSAKEAFLEWRNIVDMTHPELVKKLLVEKTQHGGFHVAWRCSVVEGNQKLASRMPTREELDRDKKIRSVAFIETRGNGGQFMVSPSPGYVLLQGRWEELPEISPDERMVLLQSARMLDKLPKDVVTYPKIQTTNGVRPGDVYNEKELEEPLELLQKNGWEVVRTRGDVRYLRRPGKDAGISATYGHVAPGVFYCFTANGAPFEGSSGYSPFAVFSLLECGGDYRKAAKKLADRYSLILPTEENPEKSSPSKDRVIPDGHFTDTGNAEVLATLYGKKIRFDHRRKRWLVWNEHRWQPDVDGSINRFAIESAKLRFSEATRIDDPQQRMLAAKWAIQSESKVRIDASINLAKNLHPIADAGEDWDGDSMLLSCRNGVVDLRTGELRAGRNEDRITMVSNTSYDVTAECPRWDKFIDEVFEGDGELIEYVQRSLGYSITGSTREQVIYFCFGQGANGKSVLFSTIGALLGDYAYSAPSSMFQRNTISTSTNDVARIEFKRFLTSSETLSSTKLDELRLKKWSGGDEETARYLYSEFFSFHPVCKVWLFCNHKPSVEDDSHGFWRRVRTIPFNRVFREREQDHELASKLRQELPGILNWLICGALAWREGGLDPTPKKVLEATALYRAENDRLGDFFEECCVMDNNYSERASSLYKAYKSWADGQGLFAKDALNATSFGRIMGDRFTSKHSERGKVYYGICLRSSVGGDDLLNSNTVSDILDGKI